MVCTPVYLTLPHIAPFRARATGYKGSSDLYIDANIQLAVSAGRKLYEATGKRVHVCLPDETEYLRAKDLFKSALELSEGVSLGHLQENRDSFLTSWNNIFAGAAVPGTKRGGPSAPAAAAATADIFLTLNASTIELVDLQKYVAETIKDRVVVTWNMELDTLRADLGEE
jgi:hypothetical protein